MTVIGRRPNALALVQNGVGQSDPRCWFGPNGHINAGSASIKGMKSNGRIGGSDNGPIRQVEGMTATTSAAGRMIANQSGVDESDPAIGAYRQRPTGAALAVPGFIAEEGGFAEGD